MSDFIWVLPRDQATSLGEVGVASSYILPRAHVGMNPAELVGKFIWVVLRGESDRLALVIKAHEVAKILDGYHRDDFILKPNLQNSLRIGAAFNTLASFTTNVAAPAKEGIAAISSSDAERLHALLKKNATRRLTVPSSKSLSIFVVENLPKNHDLLARMVTQVAVSSCNFNDIWCDGRHKKYRSAPYASMAKAWIETQFPNINLVDLDDVLVISDPYASILNRKFENDEATRNSPTSGKAPRFDAIFRALDPDKVFAREFTAVDLVKLNPLASIKKTEAAERRHQEILQDISRHLLEKGIQPFESESVDLAFTRGGNLMVFEIKTTNLENAISQAAKGGFQLAYYKNALNTLYESVVTSLLLEDTGSPELNRFIFQTMKTLGISTCFYNEHLSWPYRVTDFPLS